MLDYSPTKTQKLLGNPDKSADPTVSSPACAGLAGEHCKYIWAGLGYKLKGVLLTITLRVKSFNFYQWLYPIMERPRPHLLGGVGGRSISIGGSTTLPPRATRAARRGLLPLVITFQPFFSAVNPGEAANPSRVSVRDPLVRKVATASPTPSWAGDKMWRLGGHVIWTKKLSSSAYAINRPIKRRPTYETTFIIIKSILSVKNDISEKMFIKPKIEKS